MSELWLIEDGRCEESDILRHISDRKDRNRWDSNRELDVFARRLDEVWSVHGEDIVSTIKRDPEESGLGKQFRLALDIIVDLIFGFKMRHEIFAVGDFRSIWESAPDIVLQGGCFECCVGEVDALLDFNFHSMLGTTSCEGLEEICDGVDSC